MEIVQELHMKKGKDFLDRVVKNGRKEADQ